MNRRAAVLAVAIGLDLALGELPNRWHPVAVLGAAIERVEGSTRRLPAPAGGAILALLFPAIAFGSAVAATKVTRRLPPVLAIPLEAALLKQTFSVRALFEHTRSVAVALKAGDVEAGRRAVGMMVSRETAALDEAAVASAAIESLAENASDSVVAPWGWYVVGGLPMAAAYRAVNTLDAMVGYRSKGWVGTPSARLDDGMNYLPARATAGLMAIAGRSRGAFAGAISDHGRTPSPNSGWPMAAAAHALGVRLEKAGHHILNAGGRLADPADIQAAERLIAVTLAAGAALALAGTLVVPGRRVAA